MSDWQHCVDWLLAKYCRCKLRLDWCWCRWRTSTKGLCRWASRCGAVTEPHKIILYYRLSLSTWPLSNNKELLCRRYRVMPGESLTTGSQICAKPTRMRDQSTSSILHKSPQFTLLQTRFSNIKVKVVQSLKNENKTKRGIHMGGHP
jgi:hypothetical protein